MDDSLRDLVLGLAATGIGAALGWFFRTFLWRRTLRRRQRFLGLPDNAECALVVNRDAGKAGAVARADALALLELSSLIKDCRAGVQVLPADDARQGFGERAEFCIGGPVSNPRMEAHLSVLLPGVHVNTVEFGEPDHGVITVGGERYGWEKGRTAHVLLARLTAESGQRPVFLFCGQTAVANQAAARYLVRHHLRLARKHGADGTFCLLLKVVNDAAYGPDVVELVGDVTRAARTPAPAPQGDAQDSAASA
ncbi:hypothetical protein [Streptomyces sp. JJ38]|uniref:hypothetical protein n=1 Tax=Streptomyces sp. JJ38 TaxID=2738128 RepID=UPI001C5617B0|nr:hypothetical protein [Streptomyces sp. JJ38]MBW1596053.1 hypothetical protein [Streptomyces sp. JJ38]